MSRFMRIRTIALLLLAAVAHAEYPEAPLLVDRRHDGRVGAVPRQAGRRLLRGSRLDGAERPGKGRALRARQGARTSRGGERRRDREYPGLRLHRPRGRSRPRSSAARERQAGIPIYLDLDGVCTRAPWKLPATSSTVMVLDARRRAGLRAHRCALRRRHRPDARHAGAPDGAAMSTVLVAGATGYVGSRLVPALLARGHRVRCLTRDPRRVVGGAEMCVGDALDPCDAPRGARRRRHGLLPRALDGRRRDGFRRAGPASRAQRRHRRPCGRRPASDLSRRPRPARGRPLPPSCESSGDGRRPARDRHTGDGTARGDRRGCGEHLLRDDPLPDRAPAGHGLPEMGVDAVSADRRGRRDRLPARVPRRARCPRPDPRDRRRRRPHLRRDDDAIRPRARPPAVDDPGPRADTAALVTVGRPGDPDSRRLRAAPDRGPHQRRRGDRSRRPCAAAHHPSRRLRRGGCAGPRRHGP